MRALASNHDSVMHRARLILIAVICACAGAFAPRRAFAQQQGAIPAPPPSLPGLTPDAAGKLSAEQMQALLRTVADNDEKNDKLLRNYTYIERDESHKLDRNGQAQSAESKTYEVLEIYGEQVRRQIEKDDKPLAEKDAAKEEEKLQKVMDKHKDESDNDRRKRAERDEKEREEGRRFVHEIADAYNFKLIGTELLGGREAWVIEGEPRPGFEPHVKYANLLPKFHGRVWIDKDDLQMSKMDIEAIDTVSLGLFLARVHKGSRIVIEQTRVNDEVWLPQHVAVKADVRVALLKEVRESEEQTFRDYKKFRASAKIVGYGEVKDEGKSK